MNEVPKDAIVKEIPICGCTGEQLERGETCGQGICPNAPENRGASGPLRHPRFWDEQDEPCGAIPTQEGRIDDRSLKLLSAHPAFDHRAYAWIGSEHLGGGIFSASVYTGTNATDPYLWITGGEEGLEFSACVFIGPADGEEAEDAFLIAECDGDKLGEEVVRMLMATRQASKP